MAESIAVANPLREMPRAVFPWWVVVVVGLLMVASLVSDLVAFAATEGPAEITLVVLAHLAIGLTGRWPRTGAGVAWVVMVLSVLTDHLGITVLAVFLVTASVTAQAVGSFVIAHTSLAMAWAIAVGVAAGTGQRQAVLWVAVPVTVLAFLLGLGIRNFLLHQARSDRRIAQLAESNKQIRRDERHALSRELHDVVAHELTIIRMQAMSKRHSADPEELQQTLSVVDQAARSALSELRVMLGLLREPEPGGPATSTSSNVLERAEENLEEVLTNVARQLKEVGFDVTTRFEGLRDPRIRPSIAHTCVRALQESVTNIAKHAPVNSPVSVVAEARNDQLRLEIRNQRQPGSVRAASLNAAEHLGLRSLRERATLVGGRFAAGAEGDHWVVELTIPFDSSN